jgi:hypothetical protein
MPFLSKISCGMEPQCLMCEKLRRPWHTQVSISCPVFAAWTNASREHLKNKHLLKLQCDRCWSKFQTREKFDDHDWEISFATACEPKNKPPGHVEGMSQRQYSRIIDRAKPRGETRGPSNEVEKWQSIYRILFPSEPILSPCKLYLEHVFNLSC